MPMIPQSLTLYRHPLDCVSQNSMHNAGEQLAVSNNLRRDTLRTAQFPLMTACLLILVFSHNKDLGSSR